MSLSWRQCQLVSELAAGERLKKAAAKLGMTPQAATDHLRRARIAYGAKTNTHLCVLFSRSPTVRKQ